MIGKLLYFILFKSRQWETHTVVKLNGFVSHISYKLFAYFEKHYRCRPTTLAHTVFKGRGAVSYLIVTLRR